MIRPTHVMVCEPTNCLRCNGTGLVRHAFKVGPNGPICPDCDGRKFHQVAMPIEDFAKLFTYGQAQHKDADGNWGVRNVISVTTPQPGDAGRKEG